MIGCDCAACRSTDPRDTPLAAVDLPRRVDDGDAVCSSTPATDLRAQALRFGVRRVDAILFTHSHADHILGLDEVRRFNVAAAGGRSPALRRRARRCRRPAAHVRVRLRSGDAEGRRRAAARAASRSPGRSRSAAATVVPVPLLHGPRPILGFRFGPLRLPDRLQPHPRRRRGRCSRGSTCWCSTRCATGRTPRTSRVDEARRGGARASAPRAHVLHAHLPRPRPRGDLRAAARGLELAYDGLDDWTSDVGAGRARGWHGPDVPSPDLGRR